MSDPKPPRSLAYISAKEYSHLPVKPEIITVWQSAVHIGCEPEHIPIIVTAGLLPPLGHPSKNGPKYFSRQEVQQLAADRRWQAKVCDAVRAHFRHRNENKAKSATKQE
jgi:hypothetical protein